MDQNLKNYIEKSRAAGFADQDIKAELVKAGWQQKDFADTFSRLSPSPLMDNDTYAEPVNQKIEAKSMPSAPMPKTMSGLAITALVFSFIMPFIGLVLGIIALATFKSDRQKGRGFAIAAVIISFLAMLFLFILLPIIIMIFTTPTWDVDISFPNSTADYTKAAMDCGNSVEASILIVGNKFRTCFSETSGSTGKFGFFVENSGTKRIVSWDVNASGMRGDDLKKLAVPLDPGELSSFKFEVDTSKTGEIKTVSIMPMIMADNGLASCRKPNLEWNRMRLDTLEDCDNTTWYKNIQ